MAQMEGGGFQQARLSHSVQKESSFQELPAGIGLVLFGSCAHPCPNHCGRPDGGRGALIGWTWITCHLPDGGGVLNGLTATPSQRWAGLLNDSSGGGWPPFLPQLTTALKEGISVTPVPQTQSGQSEA